MFLGNSAAVGAASWPTWRTTPGRGLSATSSLHSLATGEALATTGESIPTELVGVMGLWPFGGTLHANGNVFWKSAVSRAMSLASASSNVGAVNKMSLVGVMGLSPL